MAEVDIGQLDISPWMGHRPAMATRVFVLLALGWMGFVPGAPSQRIPWESSRPYRWMVSVDPRGKARSHSPVSLEIRLDLAAQSKRVNVDSFEIHALNEHSRPRVYHPSRLGRDRVAIPWRLESYYGTAKATLHFVMPDEKATRFAVYFDTDDAASDPSSPRYPGLVGDGDFFREGYGRREIGAHHFDAFVDLDGDGDLDLCQGGVEPFVYVLENVGGQRLVERGKLTSGGDVLTLPHNPVNRRSWVVPHFFDWDGDGDPDFFPSFMDGPYRGRVAYFENVTVPGQSLTFADRGILRTESGSDVAGGGQAGGWFPSVVFVVDFARDGDDHVDLLLGSNNHCYWYRGLGRSTKGGWRLAEAEVVRAGDEDIELFNPCFEVADVDQDGDWDLFAAPQAGQILFYENQAPPGQDPRFAKGKVLAHDDLYVQASSHPRLKVADFTGDGLLDFVVDRAWELTDLRRPEFRDYGALFRNVGSTNAPAWERVDASQGAPFTEAFQKCDAVRQNVVIAVDWDSDGRTDLLAGDCDGYVWWFRNTTDALAPIFEAGRKLRAGDHILSLADQAGHARPAVCDWNGDGRKDLICSDGSGRVTVYFNEGAATRPVLDSGRAVRTADGEEIDRGTRSHLMICDWDDDGRKDLLFSDQENPGFYFFRNEGGDEGPRLAAPRNVGLKGYMRPNFGAFVDWDGDGKRDFLACEFEHAIHFYRNVAEPAAGQAPKFASPEGEVILRPDTIMMISGVEAVDWNGDGDMDLLTGQGHGGSGLRYFERDYIEDLLGNSRPIATLLERQKRP